MVSFTNWLPRVASSNSYKELPTSFADSRDRSTEEEFIYLQKSKQENGHGNGNGNGHSSSQSSSYFDTRAFNPPSSLSSSSSLLPKTVQLLKAFLIFLIPSFVHNLYTPTSATRRKIPPTAYLNGVRGLAAFFVFCQHFMTDYYGTGLMWGYNARPQDVWAAQLPFIRLVHSGRFCVTIFYVLSGYVLGYKPVQLIRQGDLPALTNNLISAVFRRAMRLFLPLFPPLQFAAFCVWAGWFYHEESPMEEKRLSSIDGTLFQELAHVFVTFDQVINPFSQAKFRPRNIPALYTIRVEFRGSILVFTVLLGLAKTRPIARLFITTTIAFYSLLHSRWDAFLFLMGAIMAEVAHIRSSSTLSLNDFMPNDRVFRLVNFSSTILWISTFLFSLYLGCFPRFGAVSTPGYRTLCYLTPKIYHNDEGYASYWCAIGAVLLLASLENFPILQKPFNTAFARYMGDISFSIYVFHVPMYLTLGRLITVSLIKWTGHYTASFFVGGALLLPFLVCVADIQWRAFDLNSVKFARWMEKKLFL